MKQWIPSGFSRSGTKKPPTFHRLVLKHHSSATNLGCFNRKVGGGLAELGHQNWLVVGWMICSRLVGLIQWWPIQLEFWNSEIEIKVRWGKAHVTFSTFSTMTRGGLHWSKIEIVKTFNIPPPKKARFLKKETPPRRCKNESSVFPCGNWHTNTSPEVDKTKKSGAIPSSFLGRKKYCKYLFAMLLYLHFL